MKKLTINDIIEFRNKSDRSKKNFVRNIKLPPVKKIISSGGNYWITSTSAISNSYKTNDLQFIRDKIYELEEKHENNDHKGSKTMYTRNIEILYNFRDYDFSKLRPDEKISLLKKHNIDSILTINGLEVKANPHHVITFKKNDTKEIGAIWFIAKLKGYTKPEVGMFAEILYRYLEQNFSEEYKINTKYCIAIDVINKLNVNYAHLQKGIISRILDKTIEDIKKLM